MPRARSAGAEQQASFRKSFLCKFLDKLLRSTDETRATLQSGVIAMPELTGVARSPLHVRRYRRFTLRYPVHLLFRSDELTSEVEAVSRNICIAGLLLECPVRIPQHSAVNFVISVQTPTLRPLELVGEGKVVRVEETRVSGEFAVAVDCKEPIADIEAYFPADSS